MASLQTDARLFGLDLSTLWPDLKAAGAAMWNWPVLSWLTPQPDIGLIRADGASAIIAHGAKTKTKPEKQKARFYAAELPEDILLRHSVVLPALPAAALQSALALEVQRLSPFAWGATVWASALDQLATPAGGAPSTAQRWSLVITSQELLQSHLKTISSQLSGVDTSALEIWVPKTPATPMPAGTTAPHATNAAAYTLLPGFGEGTRRQRQRIGRWINIALVGLVLILLAAIAITPTAQLRLRAMDAQAQYAALQQSVAPLQQQREAMVQAQTQLQGIAKIAGQPASALKLINALTMAIPDDTNLQSLQINAGDATAKAPQVTIMGQTSNAAALMQHLGQQPGVQNVKAPSPAVRPLGAPKESFTIEMAVDLAALEAGAAPATPPPAVAPAAAPAAQPAPAALPSPAAPANPSVFSR